jgi:hypothetical protein
LFGQEFDGRAEEVVEEAPFLTVELVQESDGPGFIEAVIANPLAHMGPVFLFDMGVVIFAVRTAAGEVDGLGAVEEMTHEVVVEKLGAVVAVKPEEFEGERLFDVTELFQDIGFAAAPDSALFAPSGGNVDTVDGIGELASHGLPAVSDGIGFKEAGPGLIPLVGAHGDLVTQKGAWFGGATPTVAVAHTNGSEQPVDGGGRDPQQCLMGLPGKRASQSLVSGQPEWEDGFQPLGAGEIGRKPNALERLQDRLAVIDRLRPTAPGFGMPETFDPVQQPDGMFAMKAAVGAEFVENTALVDPAGMLVSE